MTQSLHLVRFPAPMPGSIIVGTPLHAAARTEESDHILADTNGEAATTTKLLPVVLRILQTSDPRHAFCWLPGQSGLRCSVCRSCS
jgi:hypothetical protein